MKKPTQFLFATVLILFLMIVVLDFMYVTKFMLWVLWASWSTIVAIMYTVIWRESVDCRCLEKESETE